MSLLGAANCTTYSLVLIGPLDRPWPSTTALKLVFVRQPQFCITIIVQSQIPSPQALPTSLYTSYPRGKLCKVSVRLGIFCVLMGTGLESHCKPTHRRISPLRWLTNGLSLAGQEIEACARQTGSSLDGNTTSVSANANMHRSFPNSILRKLWGCHTRVRD